MIKLFDGWVIKADENSYTLQQEREAINQKTGEPYTATANTKYYGSIEQCANSLLRTLQRRVVADKDMTAAEAVRALNLIREEVQSVFDVIEKINVKEVK